MPLEPASVPATLFDEAVARHRAGRDAEALKCCDAILASEPDRSDAWRLKAVLLSRLADTEGACAALGEAIALDPADPDLRFQQAGLLIHLGRKPDAIAALDALLAHTPDHRDALKLVASLRRESGDIAGAIVAGEALIKLRSQDAASWSSLAWSYRLALDWPRAEATSRRAAALDPQSASAQIHHAIALVMVGDPAAGLAVADRARALDPGNVDAEDARAAALRDLGRIDEALQSVARTLAIDPAHRGALLRKGLLLHDQGDPVAACAAYDELLALDPDHVDAHWNRGAALLAGGRLEEGFAEYEWRIRSPLFYRGRPRHKQPRWDGSSLAGRAILIHAEQGFGDAIQFLRYLPLVATQTDKIWVEMQPPLERLVTESNLAGAVFATGDALPDFDCRASLFSLPHLTGAMPGDPRLPMPYLKADPTRVGQWRARVDSLPQPRIGLCWRGNPSHTRDRDRSLTLDALRPLFDLAAAFVSLQRADASPEIAAAGLAARITDWSSDMDRDGAFLDTAALMMSLDLVVTVDTAIAHLAGALGRPTLLLLHRNPDFRWMLGRADTPWYPALTLLRQTRPGDWGGPVAAAAATISRLVTHG
ncbi:MAG: tetratricopeptide repeat protein [Rhodospirillaceae bacterium]|nr:tetratricopeptide repeat protein [Rhodospirillaceae bacterium]